MQANRDWSQLRAAHSIVETRLEELLLEPLERRPRRKDGVLVQTGRRNHCVIEMRSEASIQRKIFVNEQSFVVPPGNWTEQLMAENAVLHVTSENGFSKKPRARFTMDDLRYVLPGKQIKAITHDWTSGWRLEKRVTH